MENSFFSKANINNAIWTSIILIISFVANFFWKKNYSKPEEVFVTNNISHKDTLINIIQISDDSAVHKKEKLESNNQKINKGSLNHNILIKSLIDKNEKTPAEVKPLETKLVKLTSKESNLYRTASILRPKFKMPAITEGYQQGSLSSFAKIDFPTQSIKSGDICTLKLDLLDTKLLNRITPLFVDIVKEKSKYSYFQMWSEQYEITRQKMKISFVVDLRKGDYQLEYGFYLKSELNLKYPTFYYKRVKLTIE